MIPALIVGESPMSSNMLLHKSLKENIKPACSISYVIVESDGAERHQKGSDDSLDYRADAERLRGGLNEQ